MLLTLRDQWSSVMARRVSAPSRTVTVRPAAAASLGPAARDEQAGLAVHWQPDFFFSESLKPTAPRVLPGAVGR